MITYEQRTGTICVDLLVYMFSAWSSHTLDIMVHEDINYVYVFVVVKPSASHHTWNTASTQYLLGKGPNC